MTGNLDPIFHCFVSAVGKHRLLWKGARCHLIQFLGQFYIGLIHDDVKTGMDVLIHLVFDGLNYFFIAVADIGNADATREIDVFFAFHVRNDGSFSFRSKDGVCIERPLRDMLVPFI